MEIKTQKEENINKISSKEKLTYKEDLWMYFDSINEKFFFERNKAKTLLYIISQKNDIDYEYSESLNYLFNQYITQFDAHQRKFNPNIDNGKSTLNEAIKSLINGLKTQSEIYLNHTKNISENIIKSLEGFIMNQCEISSEFSGLMKRYEKEFMNVNKLVEQKQINFFQGGKSVESIMNKLEVYKNNIKNNTTPKDNDENNNENEIIDSTEEEENQKEMLENMNEILEKNKITAKQLQIEYQDYINTANAEREKYIKLSENIYDKAQHLDEEFIKKIKEEIIYLTQNELNLIENKKNNLEQILQTCQEINIENEINNFIKSKKIKFSQPKKFEYVDYNPYVVLRNRIGHTDAIEKEISSKIVECLKGIYKYEKKDRNLIQEENINFINGTVNDIWDGNNFNKTQLESLFKEHIYRMAFLHMLNQYRVEGVFVLQETSFQNFCITLMNLIEKALNEDDYECIKFCMILSQTFYLQAEKKILLQSCMTLNPIWQNKNFWVKLIEFSINDEINNSINYTLFLSEDGNSREKRVDSAVLSNLITFLFNMKLFGYSDDKSKIVIDEFIKKYNIDGNLVYATSVSISDIQDDIITESVDNIINNEIKEDSKINLNIKTEENNINIEVNDNDNDKNMNEKKDSDNENKNINYNSDEIKNNEDKSN